MQCIWWWWWWCTRSSNNLRSSRTIPVYTYGAKASRRRTHGGSSTRIQSTYLIYYFRHITRKGFYKVLQYILPAYPLGRVFKKVLPMLLRCCHSGTNISWMSMIWRCNDHNQSQWIFPQKNTWYISTTTCVNIRSLFSYYPWIFTCLIC